MQHRAEVVVLALELVEGTRRVAAGQRRLSIFGQRHVVLGVSPADDQQLAAQGQVIHGERADRLEPAEARRPPHTVYRKVKAVALKVLAHTGL